MESKAGRTAVYWLYDSRDALLYVGIARDPKIRWRQHSADKAWWPDVATRVIEWFDSLEEAALIEAASIARDLPLHNSLGAVVRGDELDGLDRVNLMAAKDTLHELVDRVSQGGAPVVLARRGHPLAVLVSYAGLKAEVPR